MPTGQNQSKHGKTDEQHPNSLGATIDHLLIVRTLYTG
jgi:hypothetical protein